MHPSARNAPLCAAPSIPYAAPDTTVIPFSANPYPISAATCSPYPVAALAPTTETARCIKSANEAEPLTHNPNGGRAHLSPLAAAWVKGNNAHSGHSSSPGITSLAPARSAAAKSPSTPSNPRRAAVSSATPSGTSPPFTNFAASQNPTRSTNPTNAFAGGSATRNKYAHASRSSSTTTHSLHNRQNRSVVKLVKFQCPRELPPDSRQQNDEHTYHHMDFRVLIGHIQAGSHADRRSGRRSPEPRSRSDSDTPKALAGPNAN